ncbi:hypothetical protein Ssi03_62870 [Sphaerisporangium siamense]|uniref:Uncharacterized protein n=1 Tax=Sphaerisporangium siamense TaxID=795645 RepID=A0A7W7GBB1_9ACTN|nr:hypothetical protein [Sphaerisporangium siamense]MBB4702595.1 hypothetical protein [Sphaerisporangium siamense]GII88297.1 hypothetical protein Ssi03_62870 [Sphaerisporangium siamense]
MGEALKATAGYADHGPHVHHLAGRAAERLTWLAYAPRTDRERVLRWTCGCRLVVYYLVAGGGRAWVRCERRRHILARPEVTETEPMRHADAERLWERILLGRAR